MLYRSMILIGVVSFVIGAGAVLAGRVWYINTKTTESFTPQSASLTYLLPADSLTGQVTTLQGVPIKQSRQGTTDTFPNSLTQGETFSTDATSAAAITFPNAIQINLESDTKWSVIEASSRQLVFQQLSGKATLSASGSALTIRVLHTVATLTSGSLTIDLTQPGIIQLQTDSDTATLAYQDLDHNSSVVTLQNGKPYRFNDARRTLTTPVPAKKRRT